MEHMLLSHFLHHQSNLQHARWKIQEWIAAHGFRSSSWQVDGLYVGPNSTSSKYKKKPLPCLFVAKNQQRGGPMNDGGCAGASSGSNSSDSGSRGMMIGRRGRDASEERCCFQMPLHYPRYSKSDYEAMPEWQLDCLLEQYGLPAAGSVEQKRMFAIGAFLWGR